MSELKPIHNRFDLGNFLLRGVIGLAAIGGFVCATCGVSALIGAPSFLTITALFPIFTGALIVGWTAVLLLILEGVKSGHLGKWLLNYVPKPLLLLSVLATIFSVVVISQALNHETRGSGFPPEFMAGFATAFYVYGGAILVGLRRAL